jgi:hypothetical protein
MIVFPLTNRYEKISTVVVFDASKKILGEEHRSRSDLVDGAEGFLWRGSKNFVLALARELGRKVKWKVCTCMGFPSFLPSCTL